jgi:hypothetical protein
MRSQAHRPAPTFWLGWALALIGAAIVTTAAVWFAFVLLAAMAGYREALP